MNLYNSKMTNKHNQWHYLFNAFGAR